MAKERKERIGDTDQFYNIKTILGKNYGKIEKITITEIGCGSIGSNLAYALVGCGFKNLNLVDGDKISSRNIPLSSPYHYADIGKNKAAILRKRLTAKFPEINVNSFDMWDYEISPSLIRSSDLVVIGVDNNSARERVNQLCVDAKIPIANLGFFGWEAAFTFFIPHVTSCWSCLFRPSSADYDEVSRLQARHKCPEPEPNVPGGIIKGSIDRLVGFSANQILKYFTKLGKTAQYYHFDIITEESDIRFFDSNNFLRPDQDCPVCQKKEMFDIGKLRKN